MKTAETPPTSSGSCSASVTGEVRAAATVSDAVPGPASADGPEVALTPAASAVETTMFLRTRRGRRNVARGLRDITAGRTGTLDSLATALARHTS